ncbi:MULTISPECIES: GNAT family N-acetyltransferase [Amycolatopsis]|uniref:GNAT family N-acetyltransferase n=1 Tax=Amycolatopsis TaxID=1813 RepID=UPI0018E36B95|nr:MULTISPECIES: GNAT family N-acetyltransferase [Amycolatopsis]
MGTPWQGRGIAAEAARGLVGWLLRQPVDSIIAHIHPAHRASAGVTAAVGLVATDEQRDGEIRTR